jgi:hypothetical protein
MSYQPESPLAPSRPHNGLPVGFAFHGRDIDLLTGLKYDGISLQRINTKSLLQKYRHESILQQFTVFGVENFMQFGNFPTLGNHAKHHISNSFNIKPIQFSNVAPSPLRQRRV